MLVLTPAGAPRKRSAVPSPRDWVIALTCAVAIEVAKYGVHLT
ncbi:hypothetical protein ABT160_15850 [Streptomyces sp. NPDC001941]